MPRIVQLCLLLLLFPLLACPLWAASDPTWTHACLLAGHHAALIATERDQGVPLTQQMARIEADAHQNQRGEAARALIRWTVRYIYEHPARNADWLRHRFELAYLLKDFRIIDREP